MTAKLTGAIACHFGDLLSSSGYPVDIQRASFMAILHDDAESLTGDLVPSLGFNIDSEKDKISAETSAINDLLGFEQNCIKKAYQDYEDRICPDSKLVKLCDILELFCHNRILYRFNLGIINWENYKLNASETWEESELSLRKYNGTTSIAQVLEDKYTVKYYSFGFPEVYNQLFETFKRIISEFPFEKYITL